MTPLIERLITEAGFSNTFEHDRLVLLCQLAARACVKEYGQYELSTQTSQRILDAFGTKMKD